MARIFEPALEAAPSLAVVAPGAARFEGYEEERSLGGMDEGVERQLEQIIAVFSEDVAHAQAVAVAAGALLFVISAAVDVVVDIDPGIVDNFMAFGDDAEDQVGFFAGDIPGGAQSQIFIKMTRPIDGVLKEEDTGRVGCHAGVMFVHGGFMVFNHESAGGKTALFIGYQTGETLERRIGPEAVFYLEQGIRLIPAVVIGESDDLTGGVFQSEITGGGEAEVPFYVQINKIKIGQMVEKGGF